VEDRWKSIFAPLTIAFLSGLVGGLLVFFLTNCIYYKPSLDLLQQQVTAINEQIQFNNAWEHYNGLREAIHEKWYYMHSADYDEEFFTPASTYNYEFEEISKHCEGIRNTLRDKKWDESWESVETGYDKLQELPGPLWVKKQE